MTDRDYSTWLTAKRLRREEWIWGRHKFYHRYAAAVQNLLEREEYGDVREVLEFGGGTGLVPTRLDGLAQAGRLRRYTIVDINPGCLTLARKRHAKRPWVTVQAGDIRSLRPTVPLVCGFAVLKHFRIEEWQRLFVQLFEEARCGLFSMPIAEACIDDGVEFTHTRLTEEFIAQAVARAGHRMIWQDAADPAEPTFAIGKA